MRTSCGMILSGVAAVAAQVAAATPTVTAVEMSQPARVGLVTITYTLSEAPAVITLDVQTNYTENAEEKWASIGGEHIWNAQGDVWKKVTTTSGTITWRPDQSWKDPNGAGFIVDGTSRKARAVVTAWPLNNTPDYMVVDISESASPNTQRYYPAVDFLPGSELGQIGAITNNSAYKTSMIVMRKIMAKDVTWTMGATSMESQRDGWNERTHQVTLTNNFYIGVFEVTQGQWALIYGTKPSNFTNAADRAMRPVEQVSYNRIYNSNNDTANASYYWPADPNPNSFLGKLRTKTGIDFGLPSEAEWEFAARAGNGDTKWGDGSGILNDDADANLALFGRYERNGGKVYDGSEYINADRSCSAENGTAIVGSYVPNSWGLYDTAGNVNEMCHDWFEGTITGYCGRVNIDIAQPANSLSGKEAGDNGNRVVRSGAFGSFAKNCRPSSRSGLKPEAYTKSFGFRVTCKGGLE